MVSARRAWACARPSHLGSPSRRMTSAGGGVPVRMTRPVTTPIVAGSTFAGVNVAEADGGGSEHALLAAIASTATRAIDKRTTFNYLTVAAWLPRPYFRVVRGVRT